MTTDRWKRSGFESDKAGANQWWVEMGGDSSLNHTAGFPSCFQVKTTAKSLAGPSRNDKDGADAYFRHRSSESQMRRCTIFAQCRGQLFVKPETADISKAKCYATQKQTWKIMEVEYGSWKIRKRV